MTYILHVEKHLTLNLLREIKGEMMAMDFGIVAAYASFVGLAALGSFTRAMFGLYKAYSTYPDFVPEKKRMGIEIIASIFFGLFAVTLLRELNVFNLGLNITAVVAGFLGADLIGLITKKLGITRGMQIVLSRQQMDTADLSDRHVRALEYAKTHGGVTNRIYQKINQTTHNVAKKELGSLVRKGRLSKTGYNKGTRYVFSSESRPGQNRVVSGPPFRRAHKRHHKRPSRKQLFEKPVEEPSYFG